MWDSVVAAASILGASFVSAIMPLVNIELILAGLGLRDPGVARVLLLTCSAATGQTAGKVVWYFTAAGIVNLRWFSMEKSEKASGSRNGAKWLTKMSERPRTAGAVVLLSAFSGIPPLLVIASLAGVARTPLNFFVPACLVVRFMCFALIVAGFDLWGS